MTNTKPKYRRPLNNHQILLLQTLYKFRFATAALITESQQANHVRVISSRLKILADQEYIGVNYDSSYKIKGKPATYYLLTKAVRYLREQPYINESTLRSIYHDKRATEPQIAHRLHVFKIHNYFKHTYPGRFSFYSKSELLGKTYLPKQRPDAFLQDKTSDQAYMLDCLEDTMSFWTLRKIIKRYIYYAEHEIWEKNQSTPQPTVLIVCESKQLQKKVSRIIAKELDNTYSDPKFLTTASEYFNDGTDIWSNVLEPEKLISL